MVKVFMCRDVFFGTRYLNIRVSKKLLLQLLLLLLLLLHWNSTFNKLFVTFPFPVAAMSQCHRGMPISSGFSSNHFPHLFFNNIMLQKKEEKLISLAFIALIINFIKYNQVIEGKCIVFKQEVNLQIERRTIQSVDIYNGLKQGIYLSEERALLTCSYISKVV